MHAAFAFGDNEAIIMGPSGFPAPPDTYVDAVNQEYLHDLPSGSLDALTTPEGLYPVTGVNTLPIDSSVAQGVTTLDREISNAPAGDRVEVFGYSQSTVIATEELSRLTGEGVDPSKVNFILVGDPNNPDGGLLERFVGLSIPSFGATFNGATPSDLYPTDIYTNEYDGFADFPRYPINLLSDLNAFLGIAYDHATYLDPLAGSQQIDLGTFGDTTYFINTDPTLPLLDPLQLIPVIGKPIYDLLEPDIRILVNLGYGSIYDGWDTQNAPNVPTPFDLFPTNIDPTQLLTALYNGAQQGFTDFVNDLQHLSFNFDFTSIQPLLDAAYTFGLTPTEIADPLNPLSNLTELINAISTFAHGDIPIQADNFIDALLGSASTDAGVLQPLADAGLALIGTLPAYDATLFIDGLEAGNLVEAIGNPIAADIALVPFALGFGVLPVVEAAAINYSEFASLF
ncbi:PE-PPE domain-containing protein [Mycobacterium sp.]|uniref:PE-PPE domain-containing protein n=1 Tax=Mycobacterium sp. TaxID=1785 RepID=UPI003D0C7247